MNDWFSFLSSLSLLKANWEFRNIQNVPLPMLVCWMGYLPATKNVIHMLSITKLTGWKAPEFEGKNFIPERANPRATHDFSAIYSKKEETETINILFRFQIETNDSYAIKIANTLVQAMSHCCPQDYKYILDSRHKDLWGEIVAIELHRLNQPQKVWQMDF